MTLVSTDNSIFHLEDVLFLIRKDDDIPKYSSCEVKLIQENEMRCVASSDTDKPNLHKETWDHIVKSLNQASRKISRAHFYWHQYSPVPTIFGGEILINYPKIRSCSIENRHTNEFLVGVEFFCDGSIHRLNFICNKEGLDQFKNQAHEHDLSHDLRNL